MNKYLHKYILLIFILINFNIKIGAEVRELKFTRLSVEEGLSQSWVLTIAQDYLGYIWIGTNDGLNKYDGYNFTVYKHNPKIKKSLSNNRILYLFEDKDKNFWVGTNNGLNLYDRNNDNFIRQPHWPSSNISCILQDSNGDLYIGSGMGLYVYKYISDSVLHIFYQSGIENSISSNMINFLLQDKNENIWIGTNNSLDIINKIDYSVICRFNNRTIPNISDNDVRYIIEDHEGRIWVGTSSGGINLIYYDSINYKNSKIFNYQNDESNIYSISKGTILSILESKNHYLWIGIENGGLDIIDLNSFNETDPKFNHYKHNPQDAKSIGNNSIHSILEDIQGNIWIGTYGNGINMCQLGVDYFSYFRNISNNLNNKFVNVIFDDNKYLWIGTEGGVNLYEKKTGILHNFTYDPYNQNSLSSNAVWAIEKDREGNIWIGTWAGGLNNYDYKKNVFYHYKFINNNPNSLSSNNIFSILEDTHGNLWIGTMGGGLNLFNKENNTFTRFIHDENNENSISENWVRMIYENSYGELWLSTTVGLDIYDKESGVFTHFYPDEDDPKSLSDKGAVVIFEDSRKNMWFGTQNGLNLFHRADSSFKCYLEEDGLPNNTINGILEDSHGNLWISTNKGISKFINGTEIPKNPVFKNFDISDGLQGNEFNRRSAYKNKEGFMFFGGINGFNAFHPDSIKDNFFIPTVIITDFYIFNKPVPINKKGSPLKKHISLTKEIILRHDQSVFSFEFTATNYIAPEKNQYAYMLEGFHPDKSGWNYVKNQRTATYTNLDPGEYTFKVKASNNDNIWNEEGVSIKLKILPPWYRTWWAYTIYFLVITSLLIILRWSILVRTKLQHKLEIEHLEKEKLNELNQIKTRFFTNISHEFRTPLTLIISPLDKILSNTIFNPQLNSQFNVILNNAKRLLRLINQLLDISKIEADYLTLEVHKGDVMKFIKAIYNLFIYQAEEKSIKYIFKSNYDNYNTYFDSDKIEKIIYNLLSNAFKFTPIGGKISLEVYIDGNDEINKTPGYLDINVKDTGRGIKQGNLENIFNRFYQAENKTSGINLGSGIGLSLIKGLIEKYRGNINVKSIYGEGTEFYIKLPHSKELFKENEIIRKEEEEYFSSLNLSYTDYYNISGTLADSNKKNKIDNENLPVLLIIEDNDELRNYLANHFKNNYNVYQTDNGRDGIEIAYDIIPDIIISDIMMPEMDGIELCKEIKTNVKTSHIPLILLTAKSSIENQIEGIETGADAYITKPFNIKLLETSINQLLESRRKLREVFSKNINVKPKDISITSIDEKFINRVLDIIETNISNPDFSVDHLSKDIGMSRAQLHRKLIAISDLPPSGFIRNIRLQRAERLLVEGQLNVSEVIHEVGIKSRSYFTKSFREMYGLSPTEYVEKMKQNNNSSK